MACTGNYVVVFVTFGSRAEAEKLACAVVSKKLASSGQVSGPVSNTYRWHGKMESAQEWLCTLKTTKAAYPKLEAAIRSLYSSEVPQIVAVPMVAGSGPYLSWIGSGAITDARMKKR